MKPRSLAYRRGVDRAVKVLAMFSALVGLFILSWILLEVVRRGVGALDFTLFTQNPTPPGIAGGGLASAIVGSFGMTVLATVIGMPVGLCVGVYLSEFGKDSGLAKQVRSFCNVLMGIPSIIVGVFVFSLIVHSTGHFSGYAGAVALAIIMLPIVARTTEDMLSLVPNGLRESALALGFPKWILISGILFRSARSGVLTGVLLAVARISGETAPLLFTALNSVYMPEGLNEPTANMPVTIFNYAMSPYPDWQALSWGASALISVGVLGLTIVARYVLREKQ